MVNPCDWTCYLNRYSDLKTAFSRRRQHLVPIRAEQHYNQHGKNEGRCCSCVCPQCDWKCYLGRYADLRIAFGDNETKAKEHYDNTGKEAGMDCTCNPLGDAERGFENEIRFRYDDTSRHNLSHDLTSVGVAVLPANKTTYTAAELYQQMGIDMLAPTNVSDAQNELEIRYTYILQQAGLYKLKFQYDATNISTGPWRNPEFRRRAMRVDMQIGQPGKTPQVFSLHVTTSSFSKEIDIICESPMEATFDAIVQLENDGVEGTSPLPNVFEFSVMWDDRNNEGALDNLAILSNIEYLSDLNSVYGDDEARIDWPDREDPLDSEMKIATFKPTDRNQLLIGKSSMMAFVAQTEGVVDAGACLSLEAVASEPSPDSDYLGFSLELCDVDGQNQYLEFAVNRKSGHNATTRVSIGWVHVSFNHPTHLRILRDRDDPTHFEISYRPDNRIHWASPFNSEAFRDAINNYTGPMDVGASMWSLDAYRYAELYHISVEECPTTCGEGTCGDLHTGCGYTLSCSSECPGDGTRYGACWDNQCMTCEALDGRNMSGKQCGQTDEICYDVQGRVHQSHRELDFPSPGPGYICDHSENMWVCLGKNRYSFLVEGKDCGTVVNECEDSVELGQCPDGATCLNHRCFDTAIE